MDEDVELLVHEDCRVLDVYSNDHIAHFQLRRTHVQRSQVEGYLMLGVSVATEDLLTVVSGSLKAREPLRLGPDDKDTLVETFGSLRDEV